MAGVARGTRRLVGEVAGDLNLAADLARGARKLFGRRRELARIAIGDIDEFGKRFRPAADRLERLRRGADADMNPVGGAPDLGDQLREVGLQEIERFPHGGERSVVERFAPVLRRGQRRRERRRRLVEFGRSSFDAAGDPGEQ